MYMKWVNLQFTHLCRDAGHVAIDALWEPEKSVNPGLRAKKTEFPALVICQFWEVIWVGE